MAWLSVEHHVYSIISILSFIIQHFGLKIICQFKEVSFEMEMRLKVKSGICRVSE